MKIIEINISGFKLLKDNFNINFLTKARVNEFDKENEIVTLEDNLYIPTTTVITGKNSSGKTSVLNMINIVNELMVTGRIKYNKLDFRNDVINLEVYFYMEGMIYLYKGDVNKNKNIVMNDSINCILSNESLKSKKYLKSYGKNITKINFDICDKYTSILEDTSILYNLTVKSAFCVMSDKIFKDNSIVNAILIMGIAEMSDSLVLKVINLFDENVVSFNYDMSSKMFNVDLAGIGLKSFNSEEMNNVFSEGTKKGLILFALAICTLNMGGTLVIDEIENSFHKNLVENIIIIFNDKRINKNKANLIFSTHYIEIVDILRRTDNIYIMKKDKYISAENLYLTYNDRISLSKSNQFNNNTFNTLLNYNQLMDIKKELMHEISNNARR